MTEHAREATKTVEIRGTVVRGYRVASGSGSASPYPRGSIELQRPCFAALGLDLSPFHPATLNVSIAPRTFEMVAPEFTFRDVDWFPPQPPEDFSFSRCEVIRGAERFAGWVYYPHPETKPAHHRDRSTVEIITRPIAAIGYGDEVGLVLRTAEIRLT